LRVEVIQLRSEREKAISIANTAESLLRAERSVQDKLTQQLKQAEADNLALKGDLGFFERLLPAGAGEGLMVRGLQAELPSPGQVRYQLLLMQAGKAQPEFSGRYEITLAGTIEGKPWVFGQPGGPRSVQLKQYARLGGLVEHPAQAVVKTVSVRVMDLSGTAKASLTVK
jgi:hypothetical protein